MAQQTYTIELKVDTSEEGHAALTEITKQYARDLLASAMLLSPGRTPQVIARTTDAFYSTEEINVLEASGTIHE